MPPAPIFILPVSLQPVKLTSPLFAALLQPMTIGPFLAFIPFVIIATVRIVIPFVVPIVAIMIIGASLCAAGLMASLLWVAIAGCAALAVGAVLALAGDIMGQAH